MGFDLSAEQDAFRRRARELADTVLAARVGRGFPDALEAAKAKTFAMPFYAPVVLAKQLATLDLLSGGRLDVGLGVGWSRDEYEAAGAPWHRRGARADEFLRVLRAAWTEDEVEFAGEFYRVPRSRIAPKPVQESHPPLLIGGYAEAGVTELFLDPNFQAGVPPLAPVLSAMELLAPGR